MRPGKGGPDPVQASHMHACHGQTPGTWKVFVAADLNYERRQRLPIVLDWQERPCGSLHDLKSGLHRWRRLR